MPDYDHEIVRLIGRIHGRIESPCLEIEAGSIIEAAFKQLIEGRYLYQNLTINLQSIEPKLAALVHEAKVRACQPTLSGFPPHPAIDDLNFAAVVVEVETRPWILGTRHMGDSDFEKLQTKYAAAGSAPLAQLPRDSWMGFFLPSVQLSCLGACKGVRTFSAHARSAPSFPTAPVARGQQVFLPVYRCEGCRTFEFTFLVQRRGLKLQLCGETPKRSVVSEGLPSDLEAIIRDADEAIGQGDRYGAFYHLRTLIEHYAKARLGQSSDWRIRGEDLIEQYKATLTPEATAILPSLLSSWKFLSESLHSRSGQAPDYLSHRKQILEHIRLVATLGVRAVVQPPS